MRSLGDEGESKEDGDEHAGLNDALEVCADKPVKRLGEIAAPQKRQQYLGDNDRQMDGGEQKKTEEQEREDERDEDGEVVQEEAVGEGKRIELFGDEAVERPDEPDIKKQDGDGIAQELAHGITSM